MDRADYSPEALTKEFELTAQDIRNWVNQDDLNQYRRTDSLINEERTELRRVRRENKDPRMDREILAKAAVWFARATEDAARVCSFIKEHQAVYPVRRLCSLLEISPAASMDGSCGVS